MELFELNKTTYEVDINPSALLLKPFKVIYNRDRSKSKEKALKELAYIYFFTDIKSDYQYIVDEDVRSDEIIKDLVLKDWKPDIKIKEAVSFYRERSTTINTSIYEAAVQSASDMSDYLKETKKYLESGDLDISKATAALTKVPQIMRDLKTAKKELILEQKETEGRSKGSKSFNMFEDGFQK